MESEGSQEWILFSPREAEFTLGSAHKGATRLDSTLSILSESVSFEAASSRPLEGQGERSLMEERELDKLDDDLHAFRDPFHSRARSTNLYSSILPTHNGLGLFPTSSQAIQRTGPEAHRNETDGNPRAPRSSEAQGPFPPSADHGSPITHETRERIERWRLEQSQAFLDGLGRQIRHRRSHSQVTGKAQLGQTEFPSKPKEDHEEIRRTGASSPDQQPEKEPAWKSFARRFVRDIIGIDEPLLSIIVGETLPEDVYPLAEAGGAEETLPTEQSPSSNRAWPDRLIYRVARELGLLVHTFSPRSPLANLEEDRSDYAGIPILDGSRPTEKNQSNIVQESCASPDSPTFSPTIRDPLQSRSLCSEAESPGFGGDGEHMKAASERLRLEREYWERELDIRMVFRFLRGQLSSQPDPDRERPLSHPQAHQLGSGERAEAIRRHHPLVAGNVPVGRSIARKQQPRRPSSSCATESLQGERRLSRVGSGDGNRNHWDLGASTTGSHLGMA